MLLLLDEDHKAHLTLLSEISLEALNELVEYALNCLRSGINEEVTHSCAAKLNVSEESADRCLDALMFLLTESSKMLISDIDFHDSLMTLGLPEGHRKHLVKVYETNQSEIRQILQQSTVQPLQYHDLEWRLDVKLASRSIRGQTTPNLLMRLHTKQGDGRQSALLQCDIPNLVNLTNGLEEALSEAKSQYTRRILRNIK